MAAKRLLDEKYWSQFINRDMVTGKVVHDGHQFENLIERLLNLMYTDLNWKPTKMTHDGNKDFKAENGEEIYWAECKNYKNKIDLKTLAATLVMAEIESINAIFFFCYSEINNQTKTKLNSFSKTSQKSIYFFDGIILDQLIYKYKKDIFPFFFPELQDSIIEADIVTYKTNPVVLCYLERNPFLNGTSEFDINNLPELQNLKLGEIIGIHVIVINTNIDSPMKYSIMLKTSNQDNFFEILFENQNYQTGDNLIYNDVELQAGATSQKSIYLKLNKWAEKVSIPTIVCMSDKKEIGKFKFSLITTLRTRRTPYMGNNYIEQRNSMCKASLYQKKLSVLYIYGGSGTGKSRMLSECASKFVSNGYHVIKLSYAEDNKHSTYIMLRELIFSLYGFSDEIIEYIIQNSYEDLELYNNNSYKEIFQIIKYIHKNRYNLSVIETLDYSLIYEKMAKGKYFFEIDDLQDWDDYGVIFLKGFYNYAKCMQRKCNTVIGIIANTDALYRQQTIEFLAHLISKQNSFEYNINSYNINGFETANQASLFIKELLGIGDDFAITKSMANYSLRPKYLAEMANYLQDIRAIETIGNTVVVPDKNFLHLSLLEMPMSIKAIIEKRWLLFLENTTNNEQYYKELISCILLSESVKLQQQHFGIDYIEDIKKLYQLGFLKRKNIKDDVYIFEHDSIKLYFQEKYSDWLKSAISYFATCKQKFLECERFEYIHKIYSSQNITLNDYYHYMEFNYSDDVKDKINVQVLYIILQHNTNNLYEILKDIFNCTREQFGEKKVESYYFIFEETYRVDSKQLSCEEYCDIYLDYAENQLKMKETEKAIEIYESIIKKINKNPFPESKRMLARIYNRYFVCGRVGSYINQYACKWNKSLKISLKNNFYDLCIENYFDKAQSLFLDMNVLPDAIEYLEQGCCDYMKFRPANLYGHYLYRHIQLKFLKKDYKKLEDIIWDYDSSITEEDNIKFKLFFKIQFLIFKITLCLLGQKKCSDFEIENMLEQLNSFQSMQNTLQLYRYFYLYGKYYIHKRNWPRAYLFYEKAFNNLDENIKTEELELQCEVIVQDMLIGFKRNNFPFTKYDMSIFDSVLKDGTFRQINIMSNEEFSEFYKHYIPQAPIINEQTKEAFLLF
ncbi:MAG: restriction endonuclease [Clostridia bacterium]|nr:restriction endonuclease [Clostridia bacterium]